MSKELISVTLLNDGSGLSRHLFSTGSYIDKVVHEPWVKTTEEIAETQEDGETHSLKKLITSLQSQIIRNVQRT